MEDENIDCERYSYQSGLTGNEIGVEFWKKEMKNGFPIVRIVINKDPFEIAPNDILGLIRCLQSVFAHSQL